MQRLGNPHSQSHVGELTRRAVQLIGRLLPAGTSGGVERSVELA
jgi:hypothetical protein